MTATNNPSLVIGPSGYPLTLASLPSTQTTRWSAFRKAEVVAAVNGHLLGFEEACDRYNLTTEELVSWQRAYRQDGLAGLRITKLKDYRVVRRRM